MRTYHCDTCGNPVYFENTRCNRCHSELGVIPEVLRVVSLRPNPDGTWSALSALAGEALYRKCENYAVHDVCNWMVPVASGKRYCIACELNQTIPNLSRPGFTGRWYRLERSKRRLIYSLLKLGLPLQSKSVDPENGLAFAFLSQADAPQDRPVVTGHAKGLITINIDEADPAQRERTRLDLNEKYRTLLGHFRHETGHYYWDRLVRDSRDIDGFRALFGDERASYSDALQRYYRHGAPSDWQAHYIAAYASSHPWEDWAETWAHYLHIIDTLETAVHFGVRVERPLTQGRTLRSEPRFDPYRVERFDDVIEHWIPLTRALNSLNRSMGLLDLYPFVLSKPAVRKLAFVHRLVRDHRHFDVGYADDRDIERHAGGRSIMQRLMGVLGARFKGMRF